MAREQDRSGTQAWPSWVDGRLVAAGQPAIAADDAGFQLGLSVFDTLLFEHGTVLFREAHLERLERGARELGIDLAGLGVRAALDGFLEELPGGAPDPVLVRVTVTRGRPGGGPCVVLTLRAVEALPPGGVTLALASVAKSAGDATEGIKSTNRLRNVLALEEARAQGAWEALFATTDGELSEGTISNLFLVLEDGTVATPELAHGCLAGTTRALVIDELTRAGSAVAERRLTLTDLAQAREAFLTNTSQRVVPVRAVLSASGELLETRLDPRGPVSGRARQLVAEAEGRYIARKQA